MSFIESFGSSLRKLFDKLTRQTNIDEKAITEAVNELERTLIKADVSLDLVTWVGEEIKMKMKTQEPAPGVTKRDLLVKVFYDELIKLLGGEKGEVIWPKRDKLYKIVLVGLQGSGKTTTAAKLANFYLKRGYRVGLIAADTYRPAGKDQLIQLGAKVGIPVYTSDDESITIAEEGVRNFEKQGMNLVVVDTAGRHKEEKGLLEEMEKIVQAVAPDDVYLVIDGTIGQQARAQAEAFAKRIPVGSIIITKLDGSAKGGGAISAVAVTGSKIRFIGEGEGIDDFEPFDPPGFISRLLGLGDVKALVEKVREAQVDEERIRDIMTTGKFTLIDFEYQLDSISKIGSFSKFLNLIPGMSSIPSELTKNTEADLKKWRTILRSMRRSEKLDPSIISSQRIKKIAIGSGTRPEDVRQLLKRYDMFRSQLKMIKRNRALLRRLSQYGLNV
jgi:signal recognition particle subunit SRP54